MKKDATTSEEEEEEEDGRNMQASSEDTVRSPPSGGTNSKNSSADTPAPSESSTLSRRINAKLGRARSENKVGQERRNAAEDMIASAERRQEEDGKEAKGRKRRNVKGKDMPEAPRWRADTGGGDAKVEPHREKLESNSSETEGHDGPLSEGKAKEASPDKVSDDDVVAAAEEATEPSGAQAHVASRPPQPRLRHHRHHSGGSKGTATGSKDVAHLQLQSPRNSAPCGNPRERAATARGPRPAEEPPRGGSSTYRATTNADDSDADADADTDTEPVSEIRRPGQTPVDAVAGMGSHGRRPTPRTLIKPSGSKGLSGSMHSLHLPRQKSDVSVSNSDLREPSPISDGSAPTRRSAPINKQSRDNRSPLLKVDSDSLVMDLVLASAAGTLHAPPLCLILLRSLTFAPWDSPHIFPVTSVPCGRRHSVEQPLAGGHHHRPEPGHGRHAQDSGQGWWSPSRLLEPRSHH